MAASLLDPPFPPSYSQFGPPRLSFKPLSSDLNYKFTPLLRPPTATARKCLCAAAETVVPSSSPADTPLDHSATLERIKDRRKVVRVAWKKLVRWSRSLQSKANTDVLERTNKIVVLGGGSFGTAMAAHVAERKAKLEVHMLVRSPVICQSINENHFNSKYFPTHKLPENVIATTDAKAALQGADFCFHAVPVQFSASFLEGISDFVDPGLPLISLSKGLELNTFRTMSQIIPRALRNPRQPYVVLSGPSFALELMNKLPTAMVVASKDKKMANAVQQLLASRTMRINTSSDVTGVEIAGALKNVLAIAAGIVEGLNLGNNSMAALVSQGCSEIRWLATKMGAKSTTLTGLSGAGDIMLTCFVNLSRNKLGRDIVDLMLTRIYIEGKVWEKSAIITASVKSAQMLDPFNNQVVLFTRKVKLVNEVLEKEEPSLNIKVDLFPSSSDLTSSVKVILGSVELCCDSDFMKNILEFLYVMQHLSFQQ